MRLSWLKCRLLCPKTLYLASLDHLEAQAAPIPQTGPPESRKLALVSEARHKPPQS